METAFKAFFLLVLCGGNALKFLKAHFVMPRLFCFAWDIIIFA